jgi:hypothetical protein
VAVDIVKLRYDLIQTSNSGPDLVGSIRRNVPPQFAAVVLVLRGKTTSLLGIEQQLQSGALRICFQLVYDVSNQK